MTHHTMVAPLPPCAQGGTFLIGVPAVRISYWRARGPKRFIDARGARDAFVLPIDPQMRRVR
jgi:hypothetical protein